MITAEGAPALGVLRGMPPQRAMWGGSMDGPGPVVAGGTVFVNSGYTIGGTSGNVLLAFTVDGR